MVLAQRAVFGGEAGIGGRGDDGSRHGLVFKVAQDVAGGLGVFLLEAPGIGEQQAFARRGLGGGRGREIEPERQGQDQGAEGGKPSEAAAEGGRDLHGGRRRSE